jgi:hypothetical protein
MSPRWAGRRCRSVRRPRAGRKRAHARPTSDNHRSARLQNDQLFTPELGDAETHCDREMSTLVVKRLRARARSSVLSLGPTASGDTVAPLGFDPSGGTEMTVGGRMALTTPGPDLPLRLRTSEVDAKARTSTQGSPEGDMRVHLHGVLLAKSETESGAPAGREEGLEDPVADLGRDAGAVVAHRQDGRPIRAMASARAQR